MVFMLKLAEWISVGRYWIRKRVAGLGERCREMGMEREGVEGSLEWMERVAE